MRQVFLTAAFILLLSPLGFGAPHLTNTVSFQLKDEWMSCNIDSDCAGGVVCCECWAPVNKKHMKEIVKVYEHCSGACDGSCKPDNSPVAYV